MVKKLYRHEFAALGRMLLPIYAICLAIAGVFSLSIVWTTRSNGSAVANITNGISGIGFVLAMIGIAVTTAALLIIRFYNNFAKNEGYLTMSLPIKTETHIICKLICALIFEALAVVVAVASIMLVLAGAGYLDNVWSEIRALLDIVFRLMSEGVIKPSESILVTVQLILTMILSAVQGLLLAYAAISMGQRFAKKVGMSILWYFVFYFAQQIITTVVVSLNEDTFSATVTTDSINLSASISAPLWLTIVLTSVFSVVLYLITRYNLKNRLNLE